MPTKSSSPRRRRVRIALAAALIAAGCSGGGGGCGSSCGGAFKTVDDQGRPFPTPGDRLDNVAQVRLTKSGFDFLNAAHLNEVLASLNGESAIRQTFTAPAGINAAVFWYRAVCPGNVAHGWATATLQDNTASTVTTVLPRTCSNTGSWTQVTAPLTEKHSYTLTLANHDADDAAGPTFTFYDDVSVTGPSNPIKNGTFEVGSLAGWGSAGTAEIDRLPHSGGYAAQVGSSSPGVSIPCIDAGTLFNLCSPFNITRVHLIAGDENFNGVCDPGDKTPLHITFKDVSWTLDPIHNALKAHLVMHLKTGDIYLRTVEEHSSICRGTSAIQARVGYDDALPGLPRRYTTADLNIGFSTAPDGRLELNFDDASLASLVTRFQPGGLIFDGKIGDDPAPPPSGSYSGNGCDAASGTYTVAKSSTELSCSAVFNDISAGCDVTQINGGALCSIVQYVRGYLFDTIKNAFKDRIVAVLRKQLDNRRCQRSADSQGHAVACDATHACPADDDGRQLECDTARGVCYPRGQGNANYNCQPISLGINGELDVGGLTDKVGFPPGTRLDVFAGLGSKGAGGGAKVDDNGLQLAAAAATRPGSNYLSLCVQGVIPGPPQNPPAIDFDDGNNKPAGVSTYEVGFALASEMLNRGFLDAFNAGLLCVAISDKTTPFISSGLFETFLPSLGLVTGGADAPMVIVLRPTLPPFVRVGRNTYKKNSDGTDTPDDPLITLSFKKMNFDFYALVDERQARIFTLQADVRLPLALRTFAEANSDTLQPVMGGLDTVLTNVSALSPDGDAYGKKDMLAEDAGVVKGLLGAAVRLAQPLLAGVIKPIALPSMMGLKLGIAGVAGAVPRSNDVATDGYAHLALWAKVNECGTACGQYTVKTAARVVNRTIPESVKEIREGRPPSLELELSAQQAREGAAQFSYRVDGSLWSPWLSGPRLVLRDPLFLVQGHHLVEVTARDADDDHTMDPQPVAIDFFVSYQRPTVSLAQRPDGAIVTRAHSPASRHEQLLFSYRLDGQLAWSQPGPARVVTQEELSGHGLWVGVSDEAGRSAEAHFGEEEGAALAYSGAGGGCATGAHQTAWGLVPLLLALALRRRQRKGSISGG